MTDKIDTQAENLVNFIEGQRKLISEAQTSYKAAESHGDKVAALKNFLTKKAALEASLPPRDSNCLFSIGTGTATVVTTVTVVA